jgi:hypothetical protein
MFATKKYPSNFAVCHTCDNPSCVRNDDDGEYIVNDVSYQRCGHLYLATSPVNSADMVQKKRGAIGDKNGSRLYPERLVRGEDHPESVLTEHDIIEIRRLYASGMWTYDEIATTYGLGKSTVARIINRQAWKHVL